MPAGMRLSQGLLPSMESTEKQTPRPGNACCNGNNNIKCEEDRTAPHINKSVSRTPRINGKRDTSVLNLRRAKALEKTRRQRGVYCCIASCSNVHSLKSRQGTHTVVYGTKRQYRRRVIPNGLCQAYKCPEVTTENGSNDNASAAAAGGGRDRGGGGGGGVASQLVRVKRKYHRSNAFSKLPYINAKKANTRRKSTSSMVGEISTEDLIKDFQGFIDTFAVPTHLYKYLAERHRVRRLFAYRNLSYLMPSVTGKRLPRPRPSLEEIVNRLKQNCLHNQSLASSKALKLDHSLLPPGEWPQELELIFDGFFDSEKELEWVTVNASVSICLRFGWAWRRKMCPNDTLVKITNHPIRMNCYSQSTGYSTIITTNTNSGSLTNNTSNGCSGAHINNNNAHEKDDKRKQVTNNNHNNMNTCRFSITHLLDEFDWQVSGSRLTSIQLELHVSAVEKRLLKRPDMHNSSAKGIPAASMTMNLPTNQNNTNTTTLQSTSTPSTPPSSSSSSSFILQENPVNRKSGLSVASYPVHYVTAPLPMITTPYNFNTSSALRQFQLTPGYYELRLGVDSSDTIESTCSTTTAATTINSKTIPVNSPPVSEPVDSTCSGPVEWKRIRFPKASTAIDEYSRWPRLRFSVVWHKKPVVNNNNNNETISSSRLIGTRSQDTKNNTNTTINKINSNHIDSPVEGRVSHTRSMTNSLSRENHQLNTSGKSNSSPTTRLSTTESHNTNGMNGNHLSNSSMDQDLSLSSSSLAAAATAASDHVHEMNHSESSVVPAAAADGGGRRGGGNGGLEEEVNQRTVLPTNSPFPYYPVSYGFVYGDNLCHWCVSTDLKCPWCDLDCARPGNKGAEALLIHLRSSHPRFRFKAKWYSTRNHLSLQVSLNDAYDGSNDCGLRRWCVGVYKNFITRRHSITPSQLFVNGWTTTDDNSINNIKIKMEDNSDQQQQQHSSALNNNIKATLRIRCPIRRFPYTHIIFWRGVEGCTSNELLDSTVSVQPMLVGHNRVYYHTITTQPIRASEFDIDSDDDDAPHWLRQHYQRKVEEFSDVNQGEIKVMELWNHFLLSIPPSIFNVSDIQVAILTCQFIHKYYRIIHSRRLRANLIIHLNNLVDYGLLSCEQLFFLIRIYDQYCTSDTSRSFLQQQNNNSQLVGDPSIQALSASSSSSSSLWPSPSAAAAGAGVTPLTTRRTPLPLSAAMIKAEELNHNSNNNNNNKRREMRIPPPPVFEALRMSFTTTTS
ncbi:unnamed protein product [Trichobilharzia szidati]|nr:unnamed protein product [Trichobilharzia szidati]